MTQRNLNLHDRLNGKPGGLARLPKRGDRLILSPRQFQCLQGVADLLDSAQIAARLGVSEHTVNGHLASAVAALGAASRRDAVRRYLALQQEHPEKVTGQILRVVGSAITTSSTPLPQTVQEERASFIAAPTSLPVPAIEGDRHELTSTLRIIGWAVGIAVGVILLILAVEPLSQSATRLGNWVVHSHRPP